MKKPEILIALALVGYGIYRWTQGGGSSAKFGSPFFSNGTGKVPSIFGARTPATAPVFGGYSTGGQGRPASGGAGSFDLSAVGEVASAAANTAWEWWKRVTGRDDRPLTGTTSSSQSGPGVFVPRPSPVSHSPVPDFNTSSGTFDLPTYQGVDDIDTSDIGSIA